MERAKKTCGQLVEERLNYILTRTKTQAWDVGAPLYRNQQRRVGRKVEMSSDSKETTP